MSGPPDSGLARRRDTPMTVVAAAAAHFGRDLDFCLQRIGTLIEHSRQAGAGLLVLPDAALGGYLADLRSPGADALPPALEPDSEYLQKGGALAGERGGGLG